VTVSFSRTLLQGVSYESTTRSRFVTKLFFSLGFTEYIFCD